MRKLFIIFIDLYKKFISPIFHYMGIRCKYYPTCSEYTKQAIKKYGVIKGRSIGCNKNFKM